MTTPHTWDPTQYHLFADHRSRPFFELAARVGATAPASVVDLGCGSGELTATLADRWPSARVLGVDNSPAMLASAAAHVRPGLSFADADLTTYLPDEAADVVISNAAYQWVDGHEEQLAAIAERLRPGGWLAVSMPGNFAAPSHVTIRDVVGQPRWQDATGGVQLRVDPVAAPERYVDLLAEAGLVPDVWETTYLQVLSGERPVLEWVRGTALRPVLDALPNELHTEFLGELADRLAAVYPPRSYGTVFGFRRVFMVGHRLPHSESSGPSRKCDSPQRIPLGCSYCR